MAKVEEWFPDFRVSLIDRLRRSDWPDFESEFWVDMSRSLVLHGANGQKATEAVTALVEDPPAFLGEVIPALREAIRAEFRRARPAPPSPAAARERAAAASNLAFDAQAEANWREISAEERDYWRALVRERLPELARFARWLEGLARGWALDGSTIANPPPEPTPGETRLPRGVKPFAWTPYSNPPNPDPAPDADTRKGS